MPLPSQSKDENKQDQIVKSMDNSHAKTFRRFFVKEGEEGDTQTYITIATTHPDRASDPELGVDGDILSKDCMLQIANYINDESSAGGDAGAYRYVSLFHDWVTKQDPSLPPAGTIVGEAEVVNYDDGHFGVVAPYEVNQYLKTEFNGEIYDADRVKYEIDKGIIAGASIEYDTSQDKYKIINSNGGKYRYIEELTAYGGQGFARARLIANPKAVVLKEIESKAKEVTTMAEEEETKPAEEPVKEEPEVKEPITEEPKEATEEKPVEELKEIKEMVASIKKQLKPESKPIKLDKKELENMEQKETMPLSVKEITSNFKLKETQDAFTGLSRSSNYANLMFKESVGSYVDSTYKLTDLRSPYGIYIGEPTMKVKCVDVGAPGGLKGMGRLQIVSNMQTKDTLDTGSNTSTYTQNAVELADLYLPSIIDTFNNQTNFFGALPKRDHLEGSNKYGWKIKTNQSSSLAVDVDDPTVVKKVVDKVKLQTPIREYRIGISVTDYMIHHSRGSVNNLFQQEANMKMNDLMVDINTDLFTEQVDATTGKKVIGLKAIADSTGNATLYGLTRSTTNRLSAASLRDTYVSTATSITAGGMRESALKPESEGALRGNLRHVMTPGARDAIFNLEDTSIRYTNDPNFGFFGAPAYDGVPIIIDYQCPTGAIFTVDFESEYLVISRAPMVTGLAKVGAADEAYLNIFLAHVYEQPRRIFERSGMTGMG